MDEQSEAPAGHRLETDRLLLRPWRVAEANIQHELWTERDPRVPPHRRIDVNGHPTVEDLAERIRAAEPAASLGLLAIERKGLGDVIGYCGLIANSRSLDGEPELAYELLRRTWGHGYATEAAAAVVDWAEQAGIPRLWATIRDWNVASRGVVEKLGFEIGRVDPDPRYGDSLVTVKRLVRPAEGPE